VTSSFFLFFNSNTPCLFYVADTYEILVYLNEENENTGDHVAEFFTALFLTKRDFSLRAKAALSKEATCSVGTSIAFLTTIHRSRPFV